MIPVVMGRSAPWMTQWIGSGEVSSSCISRWSWSSQFTSQKPPEQAIGLDLGVDIAMRFSEYDCHETALLLRWKTCVAGSPKVHDRDCLIRLHTMTALLDFTRCSPSCSSYLRRTFVHLSCTYNQLTHSHQQVMSPAVATD